MPNSPNIGFVRKEVNRQLKKWAKGRVCAEGEEAIKAGGAEYLPMPEADDDPAQNLARYKKYLLRAIFFPVVTRTLAGLVGQVFSRETVSELPGGVEFLLEDIDGAGTPLEQQAKGVLSEVLLTGRCGLLSDFPRRKGDEVATRADVEAGKYRPRVVVYRPEQIINWRETNEGGQTYLSLLVLQETAEVEDDGFELKCETRWRVFRRTPGGVTVEVWRRKDDSAVAAAEVEYEVVEPETVILDSAGQSVPKILFEFVGAQSNDSAIDEAPLYPLACLNIGHFRNSADYEQSVFLVGQPMPVISGLSEEWYTNHIKGQVTLGSATVLGLPKDGKFEIVQVAPNAMPMEAMGHKEDQMKAIGAKLIEPGTMKGTATEAAIEESSEASVLSSAARNVSAAITAAIENCLYFVGLVDSEVSIKLNSEFAVAALGAQERAEVVAAWQGAAITFDEMREVFRRANIATEENGEALAKIQAEQTAFGAGEGE